MLLKNFIFILFCVFVLWLNSSFSQEEGDVVVSKIKIDRVDIEFKTTSTYSESEIKNIIKTGNSDYFNYDDYSLDKKRIEKFYFDNGYFDALADTSSIYDSTENKMSVKFIVNENHPYIISKINYSGLEYIAGDVYNNAFLPKVILTASGDVYSKSKITSESARVLKFLQDNGYAFANMESPEIVKIETANPAERYKVIVNLKYEPAKRYQFGKTTVAINNEKYGLYINDILNELEYSEYDIYSKENLIQSENRLNRVVILENTRIVVSDIDTNSRIINFKILGTIKNKYEVAPEVLGYDISNSFFAGVGLSYSDRFFLRNQRTFSAKVVAMANTVDNYRLEFSLDLFQPHIFKNNKIAGNLNLSTVIFSIDEYRIEEIKSTVSTNYELPKYTYLNNLGLDWKLKNQRVTFKVPVVADVIPEGAFVNIFSSIIGLTLVHTQIDNFQFPTHGVYQSYLLEESGGLGSLMKKIFDISTVSYFKFSFINKFYLPVTSRPQKSTLATKFLIGDIYEYGDNTLVLSSGSAKYGLDVVPIDSKFIAGGSTSVRGWGARKLGTFDGRQNGGDFIIEGSLEHRTRPFYDKKGLIRDLGFVSFLDFGNLWDNIKNYKTTDVAVAIGVGLRYYTIVGPVRLDFGFKMYDYEPAAGTNKWLFQNNAKDIFDHKFAIQFGIGNTF